LELAANLAKLFLVQNYELNNTENLLPQPPIKKDILPSGLLPLSPNNPPWSSPTAIAVWFASVLLIAFVPALLVVPYILLNRQNSLDSFQSDPMVILLSIIGTIPAHILTLVLGWAVVTHFNRYSFRDVLGWSNSGFAWWHHLVILGGFFAFAALVNYFLPAQENELTRILRSSRTVVYFVAFMATFTAPLVEEVVYRGILYSAIQRSIGVGWAVVIVTALFAGVHFWQYWGSPGTIILICLLSLILTLIRVRTNNLLPCIILHTIFNGLQSLSLIFFEDLSSEPKTEAFFQLLK
jgi:membrane protease YdiL (CAAX protease family)